ncbi:PepSY-associated TM helix domain-containing protein [Olivibacter domesticus]|uniref:Uncharacterized iron-regulated membrane protein n=1 Tax=Olivibacter domesticus TaxID=407022 RepID=A0A1H7TDE6_OLID1|nr:PepSY-associated TM helix domain-containing protein [Olivibacter domesticus]SEL82414.1 Uncharacterized iron-regulated membrane protein [Olivibacter domesticus]
MLRKIVYQIHLWLGFITGIVIFFVSLTGCILAFEDEIKAQVEDFHHISKSANRFQSIAAIRQAAAKAMPFDVEKMGCRIDLRGGHKSALVMFFGSKGLYYCYINPYNAEVLRVADMSKDFFRIIRTGHRALFLGNIGKTLISYCMLLFVLIILSGLILWWPKKWKKSQLRSSFKIKWTAGSKRLNYELHKILGFYTLIPALLFAITGLVIGFPWFAQTYFHVISGGGGLITQEKIVSDTLSHLENEYRAIGFLDTISREHASNKNEHVAYLLPNLPADPIWIIYNPLIPTFNNLEKRYHRYFRYYDRNTLKELPSSNIESKPIDQANIAEKLFRMNYDLHTGRVLDIPSKIFVFVASLICSSLPITGFLMWKNRRFKVRKKRNLPIHKTI